MKNFTKYLTLVFLGIFIISCSKRDDNEIIDELTRITLQDLSGKVITVQTENGSLVNWRFIYFQNVMYAHWTNRGGSEGVECTLNDDGGIYALDGEVKIYLSKSADGKVVLDKFFYDNTQETMAVMYNDADAVSFSGKKYKENDGSYIGFSESQSRWGWSTTPDGIEYNTRYYLSENTYSCWTSENASNQKYLGVNIPAGVQWDRQAGPLMLIDRTGFTTPSIYKPF